MTIPRRHSTSTQQILVCKKQEITQTAEGRMIQVAYATSNTRQRMLPNVVINTYQPKGKSVIDLDYNITFNEELSFHIVFQMVTIEL
jgi:hypothetical protein